MDSACIIPVCQVCGSTDDHICETTSLVKAPSSSTACSPVGETDKDVVGSIQPRVVAKEGARPLAPLSMMARNADMGLSNRRATAVTAPRKLHIDTSSSLKRKKSDPVGPGLHRLKDQAAEWLQGLSPESMARFVAGGQAVDSTLKMRQAAWKWATSGDEVTGSPRSSPKVKGTMESEATVMSETKHDGEDQRLHEKDVVVEEEDKSDWVYHGLQH